jgi:hypothetical protein
MYWGDDGIGNHAESESTYQSPPEDCFWGKTTKPTEHHNFLNWYFVTMHQRMCALCLHRNSDLGCKVCTFWVQLVWNVSQTYTYDGLTHNQTTVHIRYKLIFTTQSN